jgi:hypothetical protein
LSAVSCARALFKNPFLLECHFFNFFNRQTVNTIVSKFIVKKEEHKTGQAIAIFAKPLKKVSVCLSVCLSGLHCFLKLHSKLFTSQLFNFSSILTTKILRCCFWLLKYYTGDTSKKRLLIFVTPEHVDLQNIKLKIGYRSSLYQLFSKRD